jgi:hypothetical protein
MGLARKKTGGPDFVHTPPGGRLRGNRAESDALLRGQTPMAANQRESLLWSTLGLFPISTKGVSEDKHNHTLCEVSEQSEESPPKLPKPSQRPSPRPASGACTPRDAITGARKPLFQSMHKNITSVEIHLTNDLQREENQLNRKLSQHLIFPHHKAQEHRLSFFCGCHAVFPEKLAESLSIMLSMMPACTSGSTSYNRLQ